MADKQELPALTRVEDRSPQELEAAAEAVGIRDVEKGEKFFARHPRIGFQAAQHLQADLAERERQLLAQQTATADAIRERDEARAEVDRLTGELGAVDAALARRDATEGKTRAEAVWAACSEAAKARPAEGQAKHWKFHYEQQRERAERLEAELATSRAEITDLQEVLDSKRDNTRLIDVALHGAGAARQASLCDLIGPARDMRIRAEKAERELATARKRPCGECHLQPGECCDICGAKEPEGVENMNDHQKRHAVLVDERNNAEAEVKRLRELLNNREQSIGALETALVKHRDGELAAQAELATTQGQVRAAREALQLAYESMTGNNDAFDPDVWTSAVNAVWAALTPDAPAEEARK